MKIHRMKKERFDARESRRIFRKELDAAQQSRKIREEQRGAVRVIPRQMLANLAKIAMSEDEPTKELRMLMAGRVVRSERVG